MDLAMIGLGRIGLSIATRVVLADIAWLDTT